ncbi:MAG TPA: ComEA family DNA-binding protein [Actinomycetota bacterium]|nr:ComEA family DNA-binding protein [Actinomycetota bacterium]
MNEIHVPPAWRAGVAALAGRRRERAALLAALAAVVALGALLWARNPPARIAPPATAPVAAARRAESARAPLLVHVAGAVRRPGLYELEPGARVADALDAAGGAGRGADVDALNLADEVSDGAKVYVPRRSETPPTGAPATTAAAPVPSASPSAPAVDVNAADQAALETIPGIGPVKAAAIVSHRDAHGPFASLADLLDVTGVGPATLESMRPYVTL